MKQPKLFSPWRVTFARFRHKYSCMLEKIKTKIKELLPGVIAVFVKSLPVLTVYQAILLLIAPTVTNRVMIVVFLVLLFVTRFLNRESK